MGRGQVELHEPRVLPVLHQGLERTLFQLHLKGKRQRQEQRHGEGQAKDGVRLNERTG